ncbi:Tigger transposable element-derived protein 6 [Cucumispora dikerogammari]|nr:Tigger transposable element-derived protein 6 [Cucumispora dikerogammari]
MSKKLSARTKIQICEQIKEKKMKDRAICAKFKISKGALFRIKSEMDKILKTKCLDDSEEDFYKLNEAIYASFCEVRNRNIPINGPVLKTVALKVAVRASMPDFKASNGWLFRFKEKHKIKFKALKRESKPADTKAAIDLMENAESLVSKYGSKNVFNCDETTLYYRSLSTKSFVSSNNNCKGVKISKERLTLLLCCSLQEEKIAPLLIEKSKSLRALKGITLSSIGVEYDHSCNEWMARSIFISWLKRLNSRMSKEKSFVALIMNNATCHSVNATFSDIDIIFLPKNTTSLIQPCDQSIIKSFKDKYVRFMTEYMIYNEISADNIDKIIKILRYLMQFA